MPPTVISPRPPDIPFDHGAALRAVAALRSANRALGATLLARAPAARRASEEFRGAYADDFIGASKELTTEDVSTRVALLDTRARIENAVTAARRAQALRRREQAEWDRSHGRSG